MLISLVSSVGIVGTGLFFDLLQLLPIRVTVIDKYETGMYANNNGLIFAIILLSLIYFMAYIATKKKQKISNHNLQFESIQEIENHQKTLPLVLQDRIIELNLISLVLIIPIFYSSTSLRLVHVVILYNYIALSNAYQFNSNKKQCVGVGLFSSVLFLLALLFVQGSGTIMAFTSHFTEGYLINFFKTVMS